MDRKSKTLEHKKKKHLGGRSSVMGEEPDKTQEWWKWTNQHDMWFLDGLPQYLRQYYCKVAKEPEECELEGKPCPVKRCPHPHPCPHHHKCPLDKNNHVDEKVHVVSPVFTPIRVTGPQTLVPRPVRHDAGFYGGATSTSNQSLDMIYAQVRNGRPVTNDHRVHVPRPNSAPPASPPSGLITVNGQPATRVGQIIQTGARRPVNNFPAIQGGPVSVTSGGSRGHYSTLPSPSPRAPPTNHSVAYSQHSLPTNHSAQVINRNSGLAGTSYIAITPETGHNPHIIYQSHSDIYPSSGVNTPDIDALYAKVNPRHPNGTPLVIAQQ